MREPVDCSQAGLFCGITRHWVRQAERDRGPPPGPTAQERERIKELEREVLELLHVNEILRNASAYFEQAELERRPK